MFSGAGDSSGEEGLNLNNFITAHTAAGGGFIDWGSLAQQWIQMKDNNAVEPTLLGVCPPPPNISVTTNNNSNAEYIACPPESSGVLEEQGEADMDMDHDSSSPPPPAPSMQYNEGIMASAAQSQVQLNGLWPPPRVSMPPPPNLHVPTVNPTAHIPSLMKLNVQNPNDIISPHIADDGNTNATTVMDAAKRKILPAWIREGLEKMEREKQKQLERQQQQEIEDGDEAVQQILRDTTTTKLQNDTVKVTNLTLEESDNSGNEEDDVIHKIIPDVSARTQMNDNAADDDSDADRDSSHHDVGKTYEQKLADLMIIVRKTLTELLLEVTNEEISNIANDAIKLRKSKASSAQVIRKSALSSITNKLGLGAYDDSSSDENATSDDESTTDDNKEDSEEEIKACIRSKRRTFAKTSEEIEQCIAASAAQEEKKFKYYTQLETAKPHKYLDEDKIATSSSSSTKHRDLGGDSRHSAVASAVTSSSSNNNKNRDNRDFGETTESKLQHSNGKRQREQRTTRFSDNKDSKSSIATAVSYISQMQSKINSANSVTNATNTLFPMTANTGLPMPGTGTQSNSINAEVSYTAAAGGGGYSNMLNAAEAALEKATKSGSKSSSISSDRPRHHHYNSYDRKYSSDSDSSSSSHNSKYSRSSSSRHKTSSSSRRHSRKRSHRDYESHRSSSHRSSRRHSRSRSRSRSRRRRH